MEPKKYRTNRILAFVITLMGFALIFSADIDRLITFYKDPGGILTVGFFTVLNPLLIFFGFSFQINSNEIINRSYFIFTKKFKINDLSHVLYHPTWRAVTPMNSKTDMRSLHIVRNSGGWRETISLANGAFREEDLADIAKRLKHLNQSIIVDEYAGALIKKYEKN